MNPPKYTLARRTVRLLGLTRNPLCRRVDRLEGALRLAVGALLVLAVGCAAASGLASHSRNAAVAAAQRQQVHQQTVVLLEDAPAARSGTSSLPRAPQPGVAAKWTLPDGSTRTGTVRVRTVAERGDSIQVWMSGDSFPAAAPTHPDQVMLRAILTALVVFGLAATALLAGYRVGRAASG
jgi:hypothetical protein